MIWRTDKPKGSPIVVYRDGNPRPEVLFLATKPYPHYYDDGGEEIPDGMIQKWASLEESSLPSNLDEAAEKYVSTLCDRVDEGLRIDTTLESAFKAGAKWDREQLMKEAMEGEVVSTSDNGWECIRIYKKLHKCDDKVKLIIVKED